MDQSDAFAFFDAFWAILFPAADLIDLKSNSELSGSGLFGGVVNVEPICSPLRWRTVLNNRLLNLN
jgi:hypothetical protein